MIFFGFFTIAPIDDEFAFESNIWSSSEIKTVHLKKGTQIRRRIIYESSIQEKSGQSWWRG